MASWIVPLTKRKLRKSSIVMNEAIFSIISAGYLFGGTVVGHRLRGVTALRSSRRCLGVGMSIVDNGYVDDIVHSERKHE